MRALAVHEDVIVVVSSCWQTTCTAVRSGDEGFVIDSPLLPDELDALPSLGVGAATATRLKGAIGEPQRRLREFDAEWYLDGRRPLGLADFQSLPTPGRISIGSETVNELEIYPADGHTADGVAIWIPWASVLICGDYLSPVEIPMISADSGGSIDAYRETLFRLSPLVNNATTVVPGHGAPLSGERALAILAEDLAYLNALSSGAGVTLPEARRSAAQKRIHERNAASG